MSSSALPQIDAAAVLRGGAETTVRLFSGEQARVIVRLLPVDEAMRVFLELLGNHYALADFITESPPGWSRTVQPADLLALTEKAVDLNFALACRWAELQAKLLQLARELANPPSRSASPPGLANSAPTTAT